MISGPFLPGDSGILKPEMPARIARLPKYKGVPVPFYAGEVNGVPDLGAARDRAVAECHLEALCWICGTKLGAFKAFVTGVINGVTRLVQEPPCHQDCAEWTARAALSDTGEPVMVWVTRSYELVIVGEVANFKMGFPEDRKFWLRGRIAAPSAIAAALRAGMGALREHARQQGPEAEKAVARLVRGLEGI
jgi:hypothetical protein